ncbi:MAG: fatty acid desaturase [Sphingomonas sp.]
MRIIPTNAAVEVGKSAAEVRARLRTGIPLFDDVITRVTGKALQGQRAVLDVTPTRYLVFNELSLAAVFTGVATLASAATTPALALAFAPAIAVGQVLLTGRLRAQQVVVGHHAVHNTFCGGHVWANRVIAEFGTLVSFSQNPVAYRTDHVKGHHRLKVFTSGTDPDAAFLLSLGFRPGMTREALWRRFWATLLSPRFHARFLWSRVRANLIDASLTRRALAIGYLGTLVALGGWLGPVASLAAIILPLGPLYHMSALAQFTSEHRWLVGELATTDLEAYAARSHGRIALAEMPRAGLKGIERVLAWTGWLFRQSGEVLYRFGVTVGDLVNHDIHHLVGVLRLKADQWPQAAFQREEAIAAGDQFELAAREALGWRAALDWVFVGLSDAQIK